MSKYHLQTLVVIFGIILLGTTWALSGNGRERFLVESSRPLSFAAFNKSLGDAAGKGKSWVHDPIRVVLEYMDSRGSRLVNIQREDESGEAADSTTVTIVEDGYLDDSVRGTWTRFKMVRVDDHTWRITDIQRAYRCWRGHHKDSYSAQPCI